MAKSYDFSGWATRNNIICSDGRTIRRDAFKDQDGDKVPLVWNHNHSDADNILGHALLENRDEGVYAYCTFNNTAQGQNAKELVMHGDITSLSIYANKLKQQPNAKNKNVTDVVHGDIKEVSLVLAGANQGAKIENIIAHGEFHDEEACIFNDYESLDLYHADESDDSDETDKKEKENTKMPEETKKQDEAAKEKTIQDVFDTFTEEQKNVVYALIGAAMEEANNKDEEENNEDMKHNAFENDINENNDVLTHAEFESIIKDAKRDGSVKEAFLAHSIENVDVLFPEVQSVNNMPTTIDREQTWVKTVMNSVHHTPFSRIKGTIIDITADEARAKGYVKGNKKVEEVVKALKRTTTPTTIYKLQKMDRDDVIDITDFDVIAYLKQEMRGKLDEELARAIVIGDGRSALDKDKINESNIRPILGDDDLYTVKRILEVTESTKESDLAKEFIKDVIKSRKLYKGAGNPTLFTTEDMLTEMLLLEDKMGRVIYDSVTKLATTLRVSNIVTMPVMDDATRTDDNENTYNCVGVLVNLSDYNVGADKGGAVNMFDDFDINFNKYEYLIETRCSGALVTPYSAISFETKRAKAAA